MSLVQEVFDKKVAAIDSMQVHDLSVIGPHAAIRAATYHRDRAPSQALKDYWDRVIVSLQEKVA